MAGNLLDTLQSWILRGAQVEPVWFVLAGSLIVLSGLTLLAAAFALGLRLANQRTARRWARLEAAWDGAVLEIVSGTRDPATLLSRVAPADGAFFVSYLMRFAPRLEGESRRRIEALAQGFLGPVMAELSNKDPERRARAVRTLGELSFGESAPRIRAALDDPAPLVAMVAARALAMYGDAGMALEILGHLRRFATWSPNFLAGLLVRSGPSIAPALRLLVVDRTRPARVRQVAVEVLRLLRDRDAARAAAEMLSIETDPEVLPELLRLLNDIGEARHLDAIRPLATHPEEPVRIHALRALARLGGGAERARLRAALEDPSPWVVLHAARGLRETGGEGTLAAAVEGHPRAELLRQVLEEVQA